MRRATTATPLSLTTIIVAVNVTITAVTAVTVPSASPRSFVVIVIPLPPLAAPLPDPRLTGDGGRRVHTEEEERVQALRSQEEKRSPTVRNNMTTYILFVIS